MLPVEIMHTNGTVILRARSSELLILPQHVRELKSRAEARDFSEYFTREALVNRPARKLFEAWLRKDRTLWPRLFKVIHREIEMKDVEAAEQMIADNLAKRAESKTQPAPEAKPEASTPSEVAKKSKSEKSPKAEARELEKAPQTTGKKAAVEDEPKRKADAKSKSSEPAKKATSKKADKPTAAKKTTKKAAPEKAAPAAKKKKVTKKGS